MQPPDQGSLDKEGEPCCFQGWGGGFGFLLNRLLHSVCVFVCMKERGRRRQTAFLEMPLHWSKHHSNIVPPMTREQPVVLKEWCEAESYMGKEGEHSEKGLRWRKSLGSVLAWGFKLKLRILYTYNLLCWSMKWTLSFSWLEFSPALSMRFFCPFICYSLKIA